MSPRKDKPPKKPKFPRRKWAPGQAPRAEKPKKGGGYDRLKENREAEREGDWPMDAETEAAVREGLEQLRRGEFAEPPDMEADAAFLCDDEDDAEE